jgi:glycine/D-amino acid oxidase-like deaminating enzyme/nitrite reductase/ring-hydroxylating ferredoxin subunit
MDTTSYWIDTASLPRFAAINRNLTVDVAVVGGGITGISTAYLLKKAGHTVALLERSRCAAMDTGHTSAHLTSVTDERLRDLAKHFGGDGARAVWEAGQAAIDQIFAQIRDEEISCDFKWVPGYLHTPLRDKKVDPHHRRSLMLEAALAKELGFDAVFEEKIPLLNLPGMRIRNQALLHPRKYLSALIGRIRGQGSHIFENSPVEAVLEKPLAIRANGHKVTCGYVVLATNNPLMGHAGLLGATLFQSKLALYTSYVLGAKIPVGAAPEACYWDTDDPYHYLRIDRRRNFALAIFGGEDHKTGQEKNTEGRFARLEKTFREIFPHPRIDWRWSGQLIESNDGLPYFGETAERQFVATAYCGNGITFATLGAMICRDKLAGIKNPWSDLFDVHRKKIIGGTWKYVRENSDYPYYMVRDRFARAEGGSVADLKPGQGKILRLKGRKVAVYRNAKKKVTACSPVCTHLGCLVQWNNAEKTWDCPCHGSRFKPTGEVLAGPAEEPLEKWPI